MAIREVVLPNGQKVTIDEWLHWPLYSTVECAAASSLALKAFTYIVGQTVPSTGLAKRSSTDSDTNQVARSRMNYDESYVAFSWTWEPFGLSDAEDTASPPNLVAAAPMMSATNIKRLQRDVMMELFIGAGIAKPMAQAPLSYVGQGVGAPAWGVGDSPVAGVNVSYGTAGNVSPKNQRLWNLPIHIGNDRAMNVKLSSPVGLISGMSQDYRIRVWLDGLKQRPVA